VAGVILLLIFFRLIGLGVLHLLLKKHYRDI
jgi:hypothetical protein